MKEILIVENHEQVSDIFGEALQQAGYHTTVVASASEAVQSAIDNHYDLVLMDMALERSSGLTAALALRGLGIKIPIILVTGGVVPVDDRLYNAAGFAATLMKPIVDMGDLLREVEKHLT